METATGGHEADPVLEQADLSEVIAGVFCEFLEVAFHSLLYIREIYPPFVFQQRQKYNVPVKMCGHPKLNQYIREVLSGIRPLVAKKAVEKVVLLIKTKEHQPVEKFVFHIQGLTELALRYHTHRAMFLSMSFSPALREDRDLVQLEEDLRGLLLKISSCDALLQPNPKDCSFTVLVHTTRAAAESAQHQQQAQNFPWISADSTQHCEMGTPNIVPLKTVSNCVIQMELTAEENSSLKLTS